MKSVCLPCLCVVLLCAATAGASAIADPFGCFNLYSLDGIGSSAAAHHSDSQGVAGAAGDVCFSSFSLHDLEWADWRYAGGIDGGDVLLNMPDATSLGLSSTNQVNILTPNAQRHLEADLVAASLVVGDLQGGGQVNPAHVEYGLLVPEPMALSAIILGAPVAIRRRGR